MEYAYATCLLSETGEEINEENLKAVLEAAGSPVQESRLKAVVAALEDTQIAETVAIETAQTKTGTGHTPGTQDQSSSETTEG